jgi:hypothetical protein
MPLRPPAREIAARTAAHAAVPSAVHDDDATASGLPAEARSIGAFIAAIAGRRANRVGRAWTLRSTPEGADEVQRRAGQRPKSRLCCAYRAVRICVSRCAPVPIRVLPAPLPEAGVTAVSPAQRKWEVFLSSVDQLFTSDIR